MGYVIIFCLVAGIIQGFCRKTTPNPVAASAVSYGICGIMNVYRTKK